MKYEYFIAVSLALTVAFNSWYIVQLLRETERLHRRIENVFDYMKAWIDEHELRSK